MSLVIMSLYSFYLQARSLFVMSLVIVSLGSVSLLIVSLGSVSLVILSLEKSLVIVSLVIVSLLTLSLGSVSLVILSLGEVSSYYVSRQCLSTHSLWLRKESHQTIHWLQRYIEDFYTLVTEIYRGFLCSGYKTSLK